MKKPIIPLFLSGMLALSSCSTKGDLVISTVGYQSVRTAFAPPATIPAEAEIAVAYSFNQDGNLAILVKNLTDEILTIDNMRSFLIKPDGTSISYYDPTVRTTQEGTYSSDTESASFNWGALAGALGVGGPLGSLLGGLTTGSSGTLGTSTVTTTILADQPKVEIGPRGSGALPKEYHVEGIGIQALKQSGIDIEASGEQSSPCRFSVCISYSFDGGATYEKLTTNFYMNSMITRSVGIGSVSNGFKYIYDRKRDALSEPIYLMHVASNIPDGKGSDSYVSGVLIDYK